MFQGSRNVHRYFLSLLGIVRSVLRETVKILRNLLERAGFPIGTVSTRKGGVEWIKTKEGWKRHRSEPTKRKVQVQAKKADAEPKPKTPKKGKESPSNSTDKKMEAPPATTISVEQHTKMKEAHAATRTPEQTAAEQAYAGHSYSSINNGLRRGSLDPKWDKPLIEKIKHLDASIASSEPLKEDVMLFRGSSMLNAEFFKELKPGDVYGDPAFTSTTVDKDYLKTANCEVHLHIRAPKGSKAAPIATEFDHEREMLLPRGSRYRVDAVREGTQTVEFKKLDGTKYYMDKPVREFQVTLLGENE